MSEPDSGLTVEEDGVRVEKSFTEDAFPVPAVRYNLSSSREDAVRVRIVDQIPESFPMDRIGFHPDYESDNWTAYKDHRVEFERVLEPGEAVETVFGIRDDDPDLDGFLETPVIEHVPVGEEIEDVLGAGDTDAVREVLAGDRTTLPGMEEAVESEPEEAAGDAVSADEDDAAEPTDADAAAAEGEPDATDHESEEPAERDSPAPRTVGDGRTAAVTPRDDTGERPDEPDEPEETALDDEAEPDAEPEPDEEPDLDDEHELDEEPESGEVPDLDDEPEPDDGAVTADEGRPGVGVEGGVAAALAAEIRSGEADPEDIRTIESELDDGVPRSVDVRIGRLQSSVADIEAYADALAEFIDGEGTAREILEDLNDQIDAVESTVSILDDRADDAEAARTELRDELSRVDDAVDDVADDVSAVDGRVDGVESSVESVETDVAAVESSVESVEASVDSVEASVESATTDIGRIDEETEEIAGDVDRLADEVEAVSAGLDTVESDLDATDDRVDDIESRLGRFDEEFDDLWDDLAEVDTRLTDIEDRLGDDIDDIEAELDAIDDHLEELEAFRKRLNEAFGP